MTTKTLTPADLAMFTGSEQFYRHSINRKVVYSEGARHVAEAGGAYWLLDEIALIQPCDACVGAEDFQVWKLTVRPDRTATLPRSRSTRWARGPSHCGWYWSTSYHRRA